MPHLLLHVVSLYKGHLRGPLTLTPNDERLALPVFTTSVCRGWDSNTRPSPCDAVALIYRKGPGVCLLNKNLSRV